MRFVEAGEVHRICDWQALVTALDEAHRGPLPLVDRSELHHHEEGHRQTYFNLPAWQLLWMWGLALGAGGMRTGQDPAGPAALRRGGVRTLLVVALM